MKIPTRILGPADGAVFERQDIAIHSRVLDPKRPARIKLRIVALFGGGLQYQYFEFMFVDLHERYLFQQGQKV